MAKESYPEFPAPEGLDISGLKEGEEKDFVCTIGLRGGNLCLKAVNGVPLSTEQESPEEEASEGEEPEEEEMGMPNEKPGDRFMKAFRQKQKPVSY